MTPSTAIRPLSPAEARVLSTLMEKARTVPDTYPMTLNGLLSGCNQKTSREPVMSLAEAEVLEALDGLRDLGLISESSGGPPEGYAAASVTGVTGTCSGVHAVTSPAVSGSPAAAVSLVVGSGVGCSAGAPVPGRTMMSTMIRMTASATMPTTMRRRQ